MDISFLHPGFLWALPLSFGPVVIHWLTKARPRRFPFSSLLLIQASSPSHFSRARLKNIILMLLRTLILVCLLLFFSHPIKHWHSALGAGTGLTTVFVIDTSYSMGLRHTGLSSLDRALSSAQLFLKNAGKNDRFGLVVFSDQVERTVKPVQDLSKMQDVIKNISLTSSPTRAVPAMESAYQMLIQDTVHQKAIILFSDMAKNAWSDLASYQGDKPFRSFDPKVKVLLAEMNPTLLNAQITEARLMPVTGALTLKGRFQIQAYGLSGRQERGWEVVMRGQTFAQGTAFLDSDTHDTYFHSPLSRSWPQWGLVQMSADNLALDDQWFFLVRQPPSYSVLVVNGAPALSPVSDEIYYISPVLQKMSAQGVRVQTMTFNEFKKTAPSEADVWLLANVPALSQSDLSKCRAHLNKGGGIWVTCGSQIKNTQALSDILPGRLMDSRQQTTAVQVNEHARTHALGKFFFEQGGFEWGNIKSTQWMSFEPAPDCTVLLSDKHTKAPLLAVGRVLNGRVAVWTSSIDKDWTNLPTKPFFPVLCQEMLFYLTGIKGHAQGRELVVNEPIEWTLDKQSHAGLTMQRPDGFSEPLSLHNNRLLYRKTNIPGIYTVQDSPKAEPLGVFAVNLDTQKNEGDLTRLNPEDFMSRFPSDHWVWVAHHEPLFKTFQEKIRGKDLSSLFLFALLFFLIGELLLISLWRRHP